MILRWHKITEQDYREAKFHFHDIGAWFVSMVNKDGLKIADKSYIVSHSDAARDLVLRRYRDELREYYESHTLHMEP